MKHIEEVRKALNSARIDYADGGARTTIQTFLLALSDLSALEADVRELVDCLKQSTDELVDSRNAFFECSSTPGGRVPSKQDRRELAWMDALIAANRAALSKFTEAQS